MIAFVARINGKPDRRLWFDVLEMFIGRAIDCHLRIQSPAIARRHAKLAVEGNRVTFVDLRSTTGTYVNGARISGPVVLVPDDRIILGHVELKFVGLTPQHVSPRDAAEARLHAAITASDDADDDRSVYADYLEARGDLDHASYLRLVLANEATPRLHELGCTLPRPWRALVTRPAIQRCDVAACPARWDRLPRHARTDIARACPQCQRDVVFCASPYEGYNREGVKVVVDDTTGPGPWGEQIKP